MGCCQSSGLATGAVRARRPQFPQSMSRPTSAESDDTFARRLQEEELRNQATNGRGGGRQTKPADAPHGVRLGGGACAAADSALNAQAKVGACRERAAMAAESRMAAQRNRGVGDPRKAAEMMSRQQRDELLGKITEVYQARREPVPMGLNLASVEQLRLHLKQLQLSSLGNPTAARVVAGAAGA